MQAKQRQKQILEFLYKYTEEQGFSPSQKEIATYCGLNSTTIVRKHLNQLEELGFIQRRSKVPRAIRLLKQGSNSILGLITPSQILEVPIKGRVAAGKPIEYIEEGEAMRLPAEMVTAPEKTYLLQVIGKSMVEESIEDGDYVIVEHRDHAYPGEMIIGMINYTEATLKRYYPEKDRVRLQPSNAQMEPLYVDPQKFSIHGAIIGVLRSYR